MGAVEVNNLNGDLVFVIEPPKVLYTVMDLPGDNGEIVRSEVRIKGLQDGGVIISNHPQLSDSEDRDQFFPLRPNESRLDIYSNRFEGIQGSGNQQQDIIEDTTGG